MALVFITFVSAMIVTNDVALITFVPLSIVIAKKANINGYVEDIVGIDFCSACVDVSIMCPGGI